MAKSQVQEKLITYHELNITCAMDLPINIEGPTSFCSNGQLAALCRS